MISYSHQVSMKLFGPPKVVREGTSAEWFSMQLVTPSGEIVPGVCRVAKEYLAECFVELGVGSVQDYTKSKTPRFKRRVNFISLRSQAADAWIAVVKAYEAEV